MSQDTNDVARKLRTISYKFLLVACIAACVLTIPTSSVCAAEVLTLDEYQKRIGEVALALDSLLYPDEEEGTTEEDRAGRTAEVIRYVRSEVAAVEAVTWESRRVAPDNTWVFERLDAYERSTNLAPEARREILRTLAERLQALNEQVAEASGATRVATDADETKRRLAGILQRPEYNKEAARGSALAELWRKFVAWLWSLMPDAPKGTLPSDSRLTQIIVVLLVAAMIGVALWRLLPLIKRQQFAARSLLERDERKVLGERLRPGQRAADLLAEAEAAAREGNLRAAIRKGYIAFLCELAERRVITLASHKTNRDYLEVVGTRPALSSAMRRLTATYESHWYGDRPTAANVWADFRTAYDQALLTDN